jgi:DNA-binding XRE family transcriptional regulator
MEGTNFKEFKEELLNRPNIRREYEALNPKYDIIQAIIARRNEMSLSQRKLANLVGMQQPAICRLERGDNNITIETLFKVANVLNLEIGCKPKSFVKV